MSASGRWAVDLMEARTRARAAAGNSNRHERVGAFLRLCGELRAGARVYASPGKAVRLLVREAARAYAAERRGARF